MEEEKTTTWSLKSRISNLLRKESSSDVEFLVGTPPKRYFCHKVILAAGSPVFETMFYGPFKQKSRVRVPDVAPKGFALMLQYLYSDSVKIQDESDAFEAAYLAKKYMIKSLFGKCENFLMDNLTLSPETIFEVYEESCFLEMKSLQDYCLRYMSRNANQIFLSKSFVKASKNTFQDILSLDIMNIDSEKDIIEALWRWGEQQCIEEGVKCSVENVRCHTKEFLKHVRFFAMTMEELVNILEKCQILEDSDELALLWNFAMPRSRKALTMPPNISTESRTRSISNSSKIQLPGEYRYDGNLTAFLIENDHTTAEITVTGLPVTVIGIVVAFKPIPCYSCNDRSLEVEVVVSNRSSNISATAKSRYEAKNGTEEVQQLLLLDDYVAISEGQVGSLTVITTGEGIRLMQCAEDTLRFDLGKSEVCLKLDKGARKSKRLTPAKELMIV